MVVQAMEKAVEDPSNEIAAVFMVGFELRQTTVIVFYQQVEDVSDHQSPVFNFIKSLEAIGCDMWNGFRNGMIQLSSLIRVAYIIGIL